MIPAPIIPWVTPVVIAGMLALTPVNTKIVTNNLLEAKNKIVTVIKKEGYTTTIENGIQVKLPFEEKTTVERPDNNTFHQKGIAEKIGSVTWGITKGVTSKVYRWVTR